MVKLTTQEDISLLQTFISHAHNKMYSYHFKYSLSVHARFGSLAKCQGWLCSLGGPTSTETRRSFEERAIERALEEM